MKRLLSALACSLALSTGATHAATVTPLSYTATPGEGTAQGGNFNYFDDGGRQLIDGVFGVNNWTVNSGFEWVGWRIANPTIVFSFGGPVSITGLTLGMNRANGSIIFTAFNGSLNGNPFSLSDSAFADNTRSNVLFPFSQPIVASTLTLILNDGGSDRWLFLDEVRFEGVASTAVIPVPGAVALMVPGLALIGFAARRRRNGAVG